MNGAVPLEVYMSILKSDSVLCHSLNETMDQFNESFGNPSLLGVKDTEYYDGIDLSMNLIDEEYLEVTEAYEALRDNGEEGLQGNREHLAKELADLIYVCVFMARKINIDIDGAFLEVHKSNMTKLDDRGKPIRNGLGKVLKGPNYKEADMKDYI